MGMGRKKRFAWGTLLGIATLAAGVVALWRTSDLGRASADLERQRAAARREGVPTEVEDLRRLVPPVPPDDNAAVLYARGFATLQATGNLKGVKADDLMRDLPEGKVKPEDLATLRTALAAAAPALIDIEVGSRRRGYSFDRPWEKGINLLFPEFAYAKTAGRALVLRALLAKDPTAAARDLRAAARLSGHVGSEPFVISPLVGAALEAYVERGVRVLGARGGAWTAAMRPVMDDLGPLPDLHRALAGESVFGRMVVDDLARLDPSTVSSFGSQGSSPPLAMRLARLKSVRDAFEARSIEHWRAVWAALPHDPTDWRAATRAASVPIPPGPSYALLEFTAPVFTEVGSLAAKMEADRRLTRTALDLWSGKPPTLPKDPFGAGPLKLRREGKGWTLWSLGPDAKDQGGKPRSKKFSDTSYDLVVVSLGR